MGDFMRRLALSVLLGLVACGDDDGALDGGAPDAGFAACDPLAGNVQPIALGEVLAAGRDAAGVVYVLEDAGDGDLRAFVSDGDTLRRHRVLGSGEGTLPGVTFYDVEVEADPPFTLYLEIPDDGEPSFSKVEAPGRNSPDAAAVGERLELLTEDDLADFTLQNLPPEVTIEYFGSYDAGQERVLVVRPSDDWSYEDFRLFVGTAEVMVEAEVRNVARQRDGGSTTIEATVDGYAVTLDFPVMLVDERIVPGPATIDYDGDLLPIELLDPDPAALDGLSFLCRE